MNKFQSTNKPFEKTVKTPAKLCTTTSKEHKPRSILRNIDFDGNIKSYHLLIEHSSWYYRSYGEVSSEMSYCSVNGDACCNKQKDTPKEVKRSLSIHEIFDNYDSATDSSSVDRFGSSNTKNCAVRRRVHFTDETKTHGLSPARRQKVNSLPDNLRSLMAAFCRIEREVWSLS